jgi:hypothetical protein
MNGLLDLFQANGATRAIPWSSAKADKLLEKIRPVDNSDTPLYIDCRSVALFQEVYYDKRFCDILETRKIFFGRGFDKKV